MLMDEIDAHLHPAWQQSLVSNLSKVFPNAQFIATTHSPLIVGGMAPEKVFRLARNEEGQVVQLTVEQAEHFRPKGKVTIKIEGKNRQEVCKALDELGQTVKHPGYFWLAYTWSNLLPSCNYCNTARGKKNQFPIKKAHVSVRLLSPDEAAKLMCKRIESKVPDRANVYYLQPEDLSVMEDPLLLHPYLDTPSDHLVFGEFGVVTPRDGSEKGKHSIDVYDLDSEQLTTARQIAQEIALRDYGDELTRGRGRSYQARLAAARALVAGYINGEEPYSAAVMANLRLYFPTHGLPNIP